MISISSSGRDAAVSHLEKRWTDTSGNLAVMRPRMMTAKDESGAADMPLKLIDLRSWEGDDDLIRLRTWQELTASLFVTDQANPAPSTCDIFLRCYHLERMLFFDHRACAHRAERTQSQIVTQGVDHIFIALLTAGATRMAHVDGELVATPGDFVVLDLARSFQLATEGMSAIQICIPRRHIAQYAGLPNSPAAKVLPSRGNPLLKLLADHLLNMRPCLTRAGSEQRNHLTSAALAICNAVLTADEDNRCGDVAPLELQVRQFVAQNLHRPDLGVELLCATFGLSRTPLYKLFETDGGVANHIRDRRMAHAMRILACAEGGAAQRVSTVAYACGYQSEKIFSRAFRRRYGVNPSQVKRTFPQAAIRPKGALLASWLQNL
ncbi:AraC family transcriptional regulator [Bradyrhizobium sp. SRS-191]|uniref:AraC family transcriptional regulator n=1 Tax=Bradyrhizobium sp. SRS-191 TaxID=2962606 RepID=UPI0027B9EDE3|nr:AraC family transcriptional regulator [Bradyrhizobium sp. SRS-191]